MRRIGSGVALVADPLIHWCMARSMSAVRLTTLTLDLGGSSVSNIDALKELKGLTTLTLVL